MYVNFHSRDHARCGLEWAETLFGQMPSSNNILTISSRDTVIVPWFMPWHIRFWSWSLFLRKWWQARHRGFAENGYITRNSHAPWAYGAAQPAGPRAALCFLSATSGKHVHHASMHATYNLCAVDKFSAVRIQCTSVHSACNVRPHYNWHFLWQHAVHIGYPQCMQDIHTVNTNEDHIHI